MLCFRCEDHNGTAWYAYRLHSHLPATDRPRASRQVAISHATAWTGPHVEEAGESTCPCQARQQQAKAACEKPTRATRDRQRPTKGWCGWLSSRARRGGSHWICHHWQLQSRRRHADGHRQPGCAQDPQPFVCARHVAVRLHVHCETGRQHYWQIGQVGGEVNASSVARYATTDTPGLCHYLTEIQSNGCEDFSSRVW